MGRVTFSRKVASEMPAEPTVAERLACLDGMKVEAERFADKIEHKNREYRRTRSWL